MAVTTALELLGNANDRISRLRWEKVTEDLNKSLQPLAKKDEIFSDCVLTSRLCQEEQANTWSK